MKNNRINLRLLCTLSSILLVSNGLQAMIEEHEKDPQALIEKNVKTLLATNKCQNCYLRGALLLMTNLNGANLTGANLELTKLQQANLRGANLTGADLRGANLTNAYETNQFPDKKIIESGAIFDEKTTLPSGKKYSKIK